MNLLATLYFPNLNPVGQPSIVAAVIATILVLLSSPRLVRSVNARRLTVQVALLLFLLLLAGTEGALPGRSFPDADDRVAAVIYVVFGFAFALESFRYSGALLRINGFFYSYVYGSVLVFLAAGMPIKSFDDSWIAQATVPVFCLLFLPVMLRLRKQARRRELKSKGLCEACGYDLTGNESGICPECGHPLNQRESTTVRKIGDFIH